MGTSIYKCFDKDFCSVNCRNSILNFISSKDPDFNNPHMWNDYLNSNSLNNHSTKVKIEKNMFYCIRYINKTQSYHKDIDKELESLISPYKNKLGTKKTSSKLELRETTVININDYTISKHSQCKNDLKKLFKIGYLCIVIMLGIIVALLCK